MPSVLLARTFGSGSIPSPHATSTAPAPPRTFLRSLAEHDAFPADITAGLGLSGGPAGSTPPSDEALQSLKSFVRDLFFFNIGGAAQIQLLSTACFIAVLFISGSILFAYKLYKRKFWVFRFTRRAEGIYIVPNALNSFLLIQGCFAIVLIAYNAITWRLTRNEVPRFVDGILLWATLTWIPLYIGAFWAGWGSFYTAPGALDKTSSSDRGRVARVLGLLPKPLLINFICLGTPLVLIASVLPPSILGQKRFSGTYDEYVEWLSYANSLSAADGSLDAASARTVVERASTIWDGVSKSIWYAEIAFTLWSFWSVVFLAFYIPAGGYLVYLLYQQVQKQKALFNANQQQNHQQQQQTAQQRTFSTGGAAGASPGDGCSDTVSERTARPSEQAAPKFKTPRPRFGGKGSPEQFQPLALPPLGDEAVGDEEGRRVQGGDSQDSSTAVPDDGLSPPNSPFALRHPRRRVKAEVRDIFFPPLRPELKRLATRRLSSHASPSSRFRYLRRCMLNLIVLYLGIISGALMFSYVTIRLAAGLYEAMLRGPGPFAKLWREGTLVASYASCVFGFLTIGAIVLRSVDSETPSRDASSKGSGGNKDRIARFARRHSGGGGGGGGEDDVDGRRDGNTNVNGEKTRTLPAVPESVGVDTTQHEASKAQYGGELEGGIKFSLGTDSVHPGALVLRPDDPMTSTASVTPEMDQGGFPRQSGSPNTSSGGNSPQTGSGTEAKQQQQRKHGNIFSVPRGNRPWAGSNSKIVEEPNERASEDGGRGEMQEVVPSSPRAFYPTPYGVVAGPSSQNGHGGSLRANQPVSPAIGRSPSMNSLAQIAAKHAEEQHQQQQQFGTPKQFDGLFKSSEVIEEGESEDIADVPGRTWVRRSSRSGATDTVASQIARDWQASQYMRAPLPATPPQPQQQLPPSTPPASSSSCFLMDLPLDAPSTPSRVPQIRSTLPREPLAPSDDRFDAAGGHGDEAIFGSPNSARSMRIAQAEAILTGADRSSMTMPPRIRRPSLPSQQRVASELLAHQPSAPLEPSPSSRSKVSRVAVPGAAPTAGASVLDSPASTRSAKARMSPGVFF